MNLLHAMNRVLTPDAVMWVAAGVSLALLALVRPVRGVLTGGGRDSLTRALRIALVFVLIMLVALPFLILVTGESVSGVACGCFLLIFPLFCYYFGKGLGTEAGRKGVMDLVGLDEFDGLEDAQDRLYESRLRIPSRDGVLASIAKLTRGDKQSGEKDAPDAGKKHPPRNSDVLDVMVEEV